MNFLRRLALQGGEKKLDGSSRLMLLKTRASLTCFRACFHPGRAKDLSAPRYKHHNIQGDHKLFALTFVPNTHLRVLMAPKTTYVIHYWPTATRKIKVSYPYPRHEAIWGSGCTDPIILHTGIRPEWMGHLHVPAALPPGKVPHNPLTTQACVPQTRPGFLPHTRNWTLCCAKPNLVALLTFCTIMHF